MGILGHKNSKRYLIIFSLFTSLTLGCNNQKYSRCQEMIAIANSATDKTQNIVRDSQEKVIEMKNWLQAADIMTIAAKEIEALPIKDPQLIDYQGNLANVFRIYSQATYDAVRARENKNLSALELASSAAQKAGNLNQTLVEKINSYCVAE